MRRKDKEISSGAEINDIIQRAQVCRVAMIDGDRPYVVPMCFGYDKQSLYLHSALKGKKIEAMATNPEVCFEVDIVGDVVRSEAPCDWSLRYQSVIGFGRAVFIEDMEEKRAALDIIFARYAGNRSPFTDNKVRATAVIRIDIEGMTGKASGL